MLMRPNQERLPIANISMYEDEPAMAVTVVFGSDGGATKAVASRIAKRMDARVVDIVEATTDDFERCSLLILGVPTYSDGELQVDWEDNIDTLKSSNIMNKKVAIFGLGDQEEYPDSFLDAMGILYEQVVMQGAEVIGFTDITDFTFSKSRAQRDGMFVGLALDEDNQPGKTTERITSWISQLK